MKVDRAATQRLLPKRACCCVCEFLKPLPSCKWRVTLTQKKIIVRARIAILAMGNFFFFIVTHGKASLPASFTDDLVRKLQYATNFVITQLSRFSQKIFNLRGDAESPIFVSALRPRQVLLVVNKRTCTIACTIMLPSCQNTHALTNPGAPNARALG